MVLQADGRQFGLVVDEINDTEEIVVKPLGKQLKGISCFAGATIMGDGKVALILDILGLAHVRRWRASRGSTPPPPPKSVWPKAAGSAESWLLFQGRGARKTGGAALHGFAARGV